MLNNTSEIIGTEEEIIYEIVDDILSTQDQIKNIQYSIKNIDETKGSGLQLLNIKNEIQRNISIINELKNEINEKKSEFNEYKIKNNMKIKKIEDEIFEKEKKLQNISSDNKEEIYKISYEKIEDIIKKKKDEDELKNITIEFNATENAKRNIENNLMDKINEREEITERLLMLKEEKENLNEQLINLISEKESLEEICKLYIQNFNSNIKEINGADNINTEKNNLNNIIKDIDINLYHFEICKIDINKYCNDISNILINAINQFYSPDLENDNNFFDYKHAELVNIIQNDLINFIELDYKKVNSEIIENFFDTLGNKLLNEIQLEIPIEKIIKLLKYFIKVNYYEVVISNNVNFLNKEYKFVKRENKRKVKEKQTEINLLANKLDELDFLLSQIKEKKDILIENNANNLNNLSPKEKEYLNLNEKIGELINQKKEFEYDYDEKLQCLDMIIKEIEDKINFIENINLDLENQIERINEKIEKENEEKKREIDNLKDSIKEKFKMIKNQLSIYKRKHGNNMELYDRFVEKINNNLRISSKSLLNNDSLSNSSYMHSLMFSPINNDSKNNSLIHNNSKNINRNTPFNSISTNSIFSLNKLNNSLYNPILNMNNTFFSPARSRNLEYYSQIYNSDNRKKLKNNLRVNNENNYEINNSNSLWEEEKTKLLNSMKSINKQKIKGNKNEINYDFINNEKEKKDYFKYNNLLKPIICYFRIIKDNKKFDPLHHSEKISEFGYEKISMKINDRYTHLNIYKNRNLIFQILIQNMQTTIVNNNIKYIIKIYQKYKHILKKDGFVDIDTFIKSRDFKNIPFDTNNIKKAAKNNLFNIQLSFINNGFNERVEFIFLNYEDVKLWLNGLNYVIKYKNENELN